MPGPNSAPNGDVRIVRGHWNEEFRCDKHRECSQATENCNVISLREWLAKRNMLRTGKS